MMNRRAFLGLVGVAAPAAAVASKMGLWDKVLAWIKAPQPLSAASSVALQLEKVREQMPVLYENDAALHRLMGIPYHHCTSSTGTWMGISRAPVRPEVERWIRAQEFWRGDQHISAEQFDDWDEDEAA